MLTMVGPLWDAASDGVSSSEESAAAADANGAPMVAAPATPSAPAVLVARNERRVTGCMGSPSVSQPLGSQTEIRGGGLVG